MPSATSIGESTFVLRGRYSKLLNTLRLISCSIESGSSRRVIFHSVASARSASVGSAKVLGSSISQKSPCDSRTSSSCHAAGESRFGTCAQRLLLHQRMRHDHQLPVIAWNIEMMHLVRQMIAIGEDAAARAHRQ